MPKSEYFCSNCGESIELEDKFCPNCGAVLSGSETSTSKTHTIHQNTPIQPLSDKTGITKENYLNLKPRYIDRCLALLIDGIIYSLFFPLWLLKDIIPNYGKSFGKTVLRLKVVNYETGLPISAGQAFVRNLLLYLFGWIDIFIPLFTEDGRRIGDYIANTIVLEDIV